MSIIYLFPHAKTCTSEVQEAWQKTEELLEKGFCPDSEWIKKTFSLFRLRRFQKRKPVKRGITKFKSIEDTFYEQ